MSKIIKNLVIAYFSIVLLKIVLALFINNPSIFSDEFFYFKMAESLIADQDLIIHNYPALQYPPLYPAVISLSHLFSDQFLAYKAAQLINALLSTLIIIPSYLLAKEFLHEKQSLKISLLVSILPPFFIFSGFIMSENLFYSLFMLNIYLIYRAAKTNSGRLFAIAGFLLGLAYLSRVLAISLLPIIAIIYIIYRKQISLKNTFFYYLAFLITISPWIIRNIPLYPSLISAFTGNYLYSDTELLYSSSSIVIGSFINWFILYSGYLILASGVLGAILYFYSIRLKEPNFRLLYIISLISLFSLLLISANHSNYSVIAKSQPFPLLTGRTVGRYIESFLPLMLIISYIFFIRQHVKISKKTAFLTSLILAFSVQLAVFPLTPLNNTSLSPFGALKYQLDSIISGGINLSYNFYPLTFIILAAFFFSLPIFLAYLFNKRGSKPAYFSYIFIFIVLTTLTASSITIYNSFQWSKNPQGNLGLWLNKNSNSQRVLIDEQEEGKIQKGPSLKLYENLNNKGASSIITFWLPNNLVEIGEISGSSPGYIVTSKSLNYPRVYKTDNGINVYYLEK